MKRTARERRWIMAALGKIPYVCADCGSRATRLEWTGQRWKIAVFHFRTCPVLRSQWSADAADNYLNGALREHGYASADYCDDLSDHRAL